MIGTDDMSSSTGMDISESFRPEDISKSDFFDFVSASEMGIGVVGIGSVSLQTAQQQHQQQSPYGAQQQQQQQHSTTHQQQSQNHERLSSNSNMTHDGGGGASSGNRNCNDGSTTNSISNGNTSDPTLQGYEFWHTDKDSSRLDSSIFEDLDRYCWQQPSTPTSSTSAHQTQQQQHLQTPAISTHNNNNSSSKTNNTNTNNSNQCDPLNIRINQANNNTNNSSVSQPNSSPSTTTTLQDNDGQIYTITVLNGGNNGEATTPTETPTWLKRDPDDSQLPSTLDLDSLLGNFSGYIKSEYPYDDSGFSTDGTKSDGLNNDVNGLSSIQQQHQQQFASNPSNPGQTLPSLVMSGFRAGLNIGQHLAVQFQNNNNDWHMMDHNAAEQTSAESLLRSALQGKGYTKGPPHPMQNGGITTLLPTGSPTVKDDEMRRMLFSTEADSLAFADSTLNTSQIFDDSQHHAQLLQLQHTATTPNGSLSQTSQAAANSNLLVDDMFLTLENAFSDDFDKMKRIANEVQQYCHTPPIESDYMSSDIMMQISPTTAPTIGATITPTTTLPTSSTNQMPSALHSPIGQNVLGPTSPLATTVVQRCKAEVTTSTTTMSTAPTTPQATTGTTTNNRSINATKTTKKYKRATSSGSNTSTNVASNNNNLNALNQNSNTNPSSATNITNKNPNTTASSTTSATSSASSTGSSSNSPPTSHCNGQRKERSLHYCSICSKGFKDKYSVNVHIRTHTGEKPFACSLCGKSFRQKAHLAKHYQTHMAQKNNHGGGAGGSNAGMVKGNGAKHHRGGVGGGSSASLVAQQQRQQLSMLGNNPNSSIQMSSPMGPNISNAPSGIGLSGGGSLNLGGLSTMGLNPNLLGVTSTVVSLNGPANSACLSANLLASGNGLLTNR